MYLGKIGALVNHEPGQGPDRPAARQGKDVLTYGSLPFAVKFV